MVQRRDYDLVAARDVGASPRADNEVERFRRAAREDQAVRILYSEKTRDAKTRLVIALGRAHRQRVGASVRIRVAGLVEVANRIEHDRRFL